MACLTHVTPSSWLSNAGQHDKGASIWVQFPRGLQTKRAAMHPTPLTLSQAPQVQFLCGLQTKRAAMHPTPLTLSSPAGTVAPRPPDQKSSHASNTTHSLTPCRYSCPAALRSPSRSCKNASAPTTPASRAAATARRTSYATYSEHDRTNVKM
eukprot:1156100-Pelagomonas_calceolata.AAC.9